VRRSLREIFKELEQDYPHLKENILSAMGNVDTQRLLDTRFLDVEGGEVRVVEPFPIVGER
jgi:tRNA 2-thiocytidine biosynthesis protein TtcA